MSDGKTRDAVEFVQMAQDYTDEEAVQILTICADIDNKYRYKTYWTPQQKAKILTDMEDEVKNRLAAINVLATVVPDEDGNATIDILGKLSIDPIHKHGFDHDHKRFEVQTANKRGEDFYGQREPANPKSKAAKQQRSRNEAVRKLQENQDS